MSTVDEATKFAWAYLLVFGRLTNGKWSYYGGCWESAEGVSYENAHEKRKALQELAITVGIDWKKSGVPEVSHQNVFLGTFNTESGSELATLGKLVLKNGDTYLLGSDDDQAAHLAETARAMLQKKDNDVTALASRLT